MIPEPTIGIIGGKGALGGHFATFFIEGGVKVLVSDLNSKLTNLELVAKSDIVIVSVPIDRVEKVLHEILPHLKPEQALIDFTSVKLASLKLMSKAKSEVLGMHPMFGNSNRISGQTVLICKSKKSGKLCEWLIKFLEQQSVNIIEMSAKDHDKAMSISQSTIHFGAIVFIDSLRRSKIPIEEIVKLSSRSSQLKILLAARLIAQDANLYGNIQMANPYTLKALKDYQKSIKELMKIIKKAKIKDFASYFEKNKKYLGPYLKQAMSDSSKLIDRFAEMKAREKSQSKNAKPGRKDIAVLGPANTYTDIAASKYSKAKKYYAASIKEVFELVEKDKVSMGIIPIENKLNGTVLETLDGLFTHKVHITSELNMVIEHCLLMLPHGKAKDIKKVISHPQALQQCQKYLRKNFPKAELIEYASTSAAVEKLLHSQNKEIAVIASRQAAENKSLDVFKSDIADEKGNSTNFIVIERGDFSPAKNPPTAQKTSIAFYFTKNKAGSLFSIFEIFAKAKINLSKIESRPSKQEFGEYVFYLDLDGGYQEKKVQKALIEVKNTVAKMKILGSY